MVAVSSRLAGAGLVIGVLANIVVVLVQLFVDPEMAVALGIIIVVLLGAGGLAVRGVGELWESPTGNRQDAFCAPPRILALRQLLW